MSPLFQFEPDVARFIEIPAAGTLSRTLHSDDDVRVVVFGFAAGEVLSEHTASRPAVIQVMRGELELTLDGEAVTAGPGAWIHMTAGLRHAVRAATPAVMLLTLLRQAAPAAEISGPALRS
jgi:quercetin dioxygenase-like cupin family protein